MYISAKLFRVITNLFSLKPSFFNLIFKTISKNNRRQKGQTGDKFCGQRVWFKEVLQTLKNVENIVLSRLLMVDTVWLLIGICSIPLKEVK